MDAEAVTAKRVAILWLLVAAVFAGFNAVYWPVRHHQRMTAPDNYLAHARALHAAGRADAALARLLTGVDQFRPSCPEPYAVLAAWQRDRGQFFEAQLREAQARLFEAGAAPDSDAAAALLRDAAARGLNIQPMPTIAGETQRYLLAPATRLCAALGAPDAAVVMTAAERLALLRIADDALALDGRIGDTGLRSPTDILVQSMGGIGGHAHIFLRGRDYGGPSRGMYLVLIDPRSGQVTQAGVFDLWESEDEARRMVRFLRNAPNEVIAAFAVADDASVYLTPDVEAELFAFGLERKTVIRRAPGFYGLRHAFAAIGVKGAARGTALQAWSPEQGDTCPARPAACGVIQPPRKRGL